MKAIIEIGKFDINYLLDIAKAADSGVAVKDGDYRLNFATTKEFFNLFSRGRLDALYRLKKIGACSVYKLAQSLQRNYATVHGDIKVLEEFELVARTPENLIFCPFDQLLINVDLLATDFDEPLQAVG